MGLPSSIRVDQGTEFVSRDLDLWAYQHGVTLDFSRPGKPTDNALIETFNGSLPGVVSECSLVPEPCGRPRKKGRIGADTTTRKRPHAAIGQKPPLMLLNHHGAASRHCEESGKLQPPAIQRSASPQRPENSTLRRSKDRPQRKR